VAAAGERDSGRKGVRNGLKRPFTPLKRRFTRASFWHSEVVFAPKVIAGKGITKWPTPGTSILYGRKELQPIMAGGSRLQTRKSVPVEEMRPTACPEKK
jgi:hypothetical protein